MLTFSFLGALQATYNATKGLVAGAGTLSRQTKIVLTDGTAAGEADGLFTADTGVAGGSVDDYFLSAGLQDLYGDQLEFTAIKFLMVEADLLNTTDLVVGAGSWPGPFGDPSDTILVRPGATMVWQTTDANGWAVDPAADLFQIASDEDALYKLTIVGVSSALSAPAAALHPEIIGTPRVGTLISCTAGDFSGNPVPAYQWKRGGLVIAGATAATYTPVNADLGSPLSRVTTLSNIAGTLVIATKGVVVLPALVLGGVADFTDPANSGLAAVL